MRERIHKVIKIAAALLILGSAYAFFCFKTGAYVPCLFYTVTGFKCAGCGITHMCLSLLKQDFKSAYGYNKALFVYILPLTVFFVNYGAKYIKTGNITLSKKQNLFVLFSVFYFILWTIVRNLY